MKSRGKSSWPGSAAALALTQNAIPKEIDVKELQKQLIADGAVYRNQ
jgi:hypothetical protein